MSTTKDTLAPAASAATWSTERDMNALEALMWRAEADPRLRSTIMALEILDTVPDWDRFVAAHDWATRLVPRFRQKVVEPLFGLGRPSWAVDGDFDLHYHLRRIRIPEPGDFATLLDVAEQIAMTPFDKARTPWEGILIEGLPDGRAAYLLKLHHSTTDGVGATQLLSRLHSRQRDPQSGKPQAPPPVPESPTGTGVLLRQVGSDARVLPDTARGALRGLRRLGRPDRLARDTARYTDSLRRVLADPDADGSPLLRGRSLSWRFGALEVAFADLRAAGKAAGGSLNDIYLAALLGGFRRYHEELGSPIERMPMAFPINVRKEGDTDGGNKFAGARIAGPVGVADPRERVAIIRELVLAARNEPAVDGLGQVAPLLARLPGPVISQVAGNLTKANDLQASNVPGIREDVFLAGAKIERTFPYAPLPGCASMITMVTHGSTACIGVNMDPAAITDTDRFMRCLTEGFAEVLALHPGSADPILHG